jgi:DNA gyrase subunit A
VVATAQGNVAQVGLDAHREPTTRAGRRVVKLGEGDEVVSVELPAKGSKHLLVATAKGCALRVPLADVPTLAGAGKGKRAVALEKGDRLIGATTRPKLPVETTRGAEDTVAQKDTPLGALGDEPAVIKQRGGFKRVLPEPELLELTELPGGNGAGAGGD